MLKRVVYTGFGEFVAALKSAERLGLRYRAGRREVRGPVKALKPAQTVFGTLNPQYEEVPGSWVEYTLDLLPDEDAEAGARDTA